MARIILAKIRVIALTISRKFLRLSSPRGPPQLVPGLHRRLPTDSTLSTSRPALDPGDPGDLRPVGSPKSHRACYIRLCEKGPQGTQVGYPAWCTALESLKIGLAHEAIFRDRDRTFPRWDRPESA